MTKAIIFDFFGVIITDDLEGIVAELKVTEPKKAAQIVATVTDASKGLIPPGDSRSTVAGILGLSTDEYKQRIKDGKVKDRELLNYITGLRPLYKTALLTNIIRNGLDVRFTPNELSTYFDAVVASCDIGYAKPEARAYEITADRLGVRLDECIMIDDRENYCQRNALEVLGVRVMVHEPTDTYSVCSDALDTPEEQEWFSAKEAGHFLGVHAKTIRFYQEHGAITNYKEEPFLLVHRDELLKLRKRGFKQRNTAEIVRSRVEISYSPRFIGRGNNLTAVPVSLLTRRYM